jgi:diazepam-binding inhibitor (GABA receptor modulator, acyl-CoA-binding protein)
MSIESTFQVFAEQAKTLKYVVDDDLAILYGNYKQAMLGDNTTDAPFFLQFQACAKWNAWTACKGKSKETAMQDYIAKVQELLKLENTDASAYTA